MVPSKHALFITGSDVARLLPMAEAIPCVEAAFAARAEGRAADQPRYRMRVPESKGAPADAPRAMMHVLGATLSAEGVLGTKTYVGTRGGAHFAVLLFSVEGPLLAVIEANLLGQIRTGAASAVATKFLAREDAQTLAVIGSGFQARAQVEAVCAVRAIREVRVAGRSPEKVQAFCEALRYSVDAAVRPAESAEAAVDGADVIVTATTSAQPVLLGHWMRAGVHVNAMGSNALDRRELDEEAVRRAGLITADDLEQARRESGDLGQVADLDWTSVHALSDVVAGRVARADAAQITLFESQGLASEDIAVAWHVYEAARKAGMGTALPLSE